VVKLGAVEAALIDLEAAFQFLAEVREGLH
jgi:hypothetical protein